MNDDKQHAVWRESIRKYGKEMQSIVCMEECSELIQAISKCLRGKPDATDNLAEEMADVTICLHLLKEMYGITDAQLNEWITRKTARQSKRMQADDPFMEGDVKLYEEHLEKEYERAYGNRSSTTRTSTTTRTR